MTIKSSGILSLAEIAAEFGGTPPYSLSNYYKGGAFVPAGVTAAIPTSGLISFSDFYGAQATVAGSRSFVDSGSFTMPAHSTCTITLLGAGGGGGGFDTYYGGTNGANAAASTVSWDGVVKLRANGGFGGTAQGDTTGSHIPQNGTNGAGGTATGGTNTTGAGAAGGLGMIWHGSTGFTQYPDATAGAGGKGGKVIFSGALGTGKVLSFSLANGAAPGSIGQAAAAVIGRYPTKGGDASLLIQWT